mgnify:CR=1 FL=1
MSNIAIVTDSTSDLSTATTSEHRVTIVPLLVIHEDRQYLDGVDITSETFYPLLKSSSRLPTTSQPSPLAFERVYRQLLDTADEIISIHISGGLSATVESARVAASTVAPSRIHVLDSGFVTYALALQVLEAARLARSGATSEEIVSAVSCMRSKTELVFTLDTLEYLHKGGRIGRVSALMGALLDIKPVIRMEGGLLVPAGKARSMKSALRTIVDILSKKFGDKKVVAAVGHGSGAEHAAQLKDLVASSLNTEGDILPFEIGPVVGVHAGPGAVGAAVTPVEY